MQNQSQKRSERGLAEADAHMHDASGPTGTTIMGDLLPPPAVSSLRSTNQCNGIMPFVLQQSTDNNRLTN